MGARPFLKQVIEGRETLVRTEAYALMQAILAGALCEIELAALLGALAARGETSEELAGFVDAMRAVMTPLPLTNRERETLVDTCGTGGDASGTFNISTAAGLVAAAAGAIVAKHGNRAVTSTCGSGDVLEAMGIPVELGPDEAAEALRRHRFVFLHAPSMHPAMRAVMPVRRALGVRTVFNVLGPLANPAGARAQVMGVYSAHLVPRVADAMHLLGMRHSFVVHGLTDVAAGTNPTLAGADRGPYGMDEMSISGTSDVAEVRGDARSSFRITPEEVGLSRAPVGSLRGGDAATNAGILRAIFAGERGPRRDVVLLNAALVLVAADIVGTPGGEPCECLRNGIRIAARAIDSGAVTALVGALSGAGD